jgi:hypothetical protein
LNKDGHAEPFRNRQHNYVELHTLQHVVKGRWRDRFSFKQVVSRSAAGFGGQQIYLLAIDKSTLATANHLGIYTASSWVFPADGDEIDVDLADVCYAEWLCERPCGRRGVQK